MRTALYLEILLLSPQSHQTVESNMAKFSHALWHTPQNQKHPTPVVDALDRMLNKTLDTVANDAKASKHRGPFCSTREGVPT